MINQTRIAQRPTPAFAAALLALLAGLPAMGCNSFGNGKLVQQLQHENERLLTEFRAERKRREEVESANRSLEARLSESEKLLARQTPGGIPNRLSSMQPAPRGLPATSATPLGDTTPRDASGTHGDPSGFRWQRRVN